MLKVEAVFVWRTKIIRMYDVLFDAEDGEKWENIKTYQDSYKNCNVIF